MSALRDHLFDGRIPPLGEDSQAAYQRSKSLFCAEWWAYAERHPWEMRWRALRTWLILTRIWVRYYLLRPLGIVKTGRCSSSGAI